MISAVAHEYLSNDHQHCSLETVQDQITVVTPTESNFPGKFDSLNFCKFFLMNNPYEC